MKPLRALGKLPPKKAGLILAAIFVCALLVCLIFGLWPFNGGGPAQGLQAKDFAVDGIGLGRPLQVYAKRLPAALIEQKMRDAEGELDMFLYEHYTLKCRDLGDGAGLRVVGIVITKGGKTSRGIGIGSGLRTLRRRYGPGEKGGDFINYNIFTGDEEKGITFKIKGGKVAGIEYYVK